MKNIEMQNTKCRTNLKLQQRARPCSKVLSKVTNPVISIIPCRPTLNGFEDDNVGQLHIAKARHRPSRPRPNKILKKNNSANFCYSNITPRLSNFVQCLNPMVFIPPMTNEVQANININPKRRPMKFATAANTRPIYEYKFPYTSSEEDEEFTQFLTKNNPIDLPLEESDFQGSDSSFETRPTLYGDKHRLHSHRPVTVARISSECSKINSAQEIYITFPEHDCDNGDISVLAIKEGANNKPMPCNSENGFILDQFSRRLEERLEIYLDNRPISIFDYEGSNCKTAPIFDLLQSSEALPDKDAVSDIEVQKKITLPTRIPTINKYTKYKNELCSSNTLDIKGEVKRFNKGSQTEPFFEDNYKEKIISLDKNDFDQNNEYCNPSSCIILTEDEEINSCEMNKTNMPTVEFCQDSNASLMSKQVLNIEDTNVCMIKTFDIDNLNKNKVAANNFADFFTPVHVAKPFVTTVPTPIPSHQKFDEAVELSLIVSHSLLHNEIYNQESDCVSKSNTAAISSPKIGERITTGGKEFISSKKLVAVTKETENTFCYKVSEGIKIENSDYDKETFIKKPLCTQTGSNEYSNETIGITVDALCDQITPSPDKIVDEINSQYSDKWESDIQESETSTDHKTEDLILTSSSEIEYSVVHESNNEVSSGEVFQSALEIGDLTISEGELGFEASLTSDMLPLGHIAIKVTPKHSSMLESLPSFSLDFNTIKQLRVSKETQTEFLNSDQFLKSRDDDTESTCTTKDVDVTISSGELIQESDKKLHDTWTQELKNLQMDNLKLRNKLSCYSGRFLRDPG